MWRLAAMLALLAVPAHGWATDNTWVAARATFYGRDNWPLHIGSCGFGFICPARWTNELASAYDVAALSDRSPLFSGSQSGSQCGQCLRVRCRDGIIPDGGGGTLDRRGLCLSDKSVKVKIVDTCPCNYPDNAASNKRWCCGDFPHLDLSQWALEKIVSDTNRWGVFGIQYTKMDCAEDIPDGEEAPPLRETPVDPHANLKPRTTDCAAVARGISRKAYGASRIARKKKAAVKKQQSYWQRWWARFRNLSPLQKQRIYKKIWDDIRKGRLSKNGHGKGK